MMKKQRRLFFLCLCALLCILPKESFAQNINVQGKVIDETGEALINVTVQIKGTMQGTITNIDGMYELPNVSPNETLIFKYVGYTTQEVRVTKARIDVSMIPDTQLLEEVVIIAYGQQKKLTVTGSIANVSTEELLRSPVPSVSNALAGRLPGLQSVQYTGLPGNDDATLRIRGIGSPNSQNPLVMVDGVERSFSQLDPNEIADITILKDASATAVFGVRGAAGVILVTTRRGEAGKTTVTVSSSAGLQLPTPFIELTNSYDYAMAYNNAQRRDGVPENQLRFSQTAIQHFKDRDQLMLYPDTDWIDYLMRKYTWMKQQNINVSGGTDAVRYFINFGALYQDGLFKTFDSDPEENFKYRRYNYRANIDFNLSKSSSLSFSIGGNVNNRTILGEDETSLFDYLNKSVPYASYGFDDQMRFLMSDQALTADYEDVNIALSRYYKLGYVIQSTNNTMLDGVYKLKLDVITKGLSFDIKGSYNSNYRHDKDRKAGMGTNSLIKYKTTLVEGVVDEQGNPKMVLIRYGDRQVLPYSESRRGGRNWSAEAALRYNRQFGEHSVSGLAMYTQNKTYYPSSFSDIPRGYVGFVGRATYDYASKYLFDFNIGINGSENFARSKRYGTFPAVSIGWVPSVESFWAPIRNTISYLKLRVTYGVVGSDSGGGRFAYLPAQYAFIAGTNNNEGRESGNDRGVNFGMNSNYWMPGAREASLGNPYITWEKHYKQNYGIDVKFFNDRLQLSADYFYQLATDIITSNSSTLPAILSIPSQNINYNEVENKGFEIELSWKDRYQDFSYSISPNLSFARNKRTKTLEVPQMYPHLYSNGHPTYQPFLYEFFEFYRAGETEQRYMEKYGKPLPKQGVVLQDGDNVYVDLNNDGEIDANDRHYTGYGDDPEITWGVNLNFNYKRLNLSLLWMGATNCWRYLEKGYYIQTFGSTGNSALSQWVLDNSWTPENADKAKLPRITFANMNHNNLGRESRVWRVDASYARLKNIELAYSIPRISFIPGLRNLNVYLSGQNLITFAPFKGHDPEGRGGVGYPLIKIINFGLRVQF